MLHLFIRSTARRTACSGGARLRLPFQGLPQAVGGTASVEFALLAPVLVFLLIGIFDYGKAAYEAMQVQDAAQAGAEYALRYGWNSGNIENAVTSTTTSISVSATPAPTQSCGCVSGTSIVSASCGSACSGGGTAGTYVTVSAQAPYSPILSYPGISLPSTLTAQTTVRIQ